MISTVLVIVEQTIETTEHFSNCSNERRTLFDSPKIIISI